MSNDILERARALQDKMVEWRRDIHMHPELGFQETRTAGIAAAELRRLGIETEVGVGKTGVVGRIGEGGPVIGIRGDMDALPIHETVDHPWKSQNPGVMHACGHDAHTAILMAVANILHDMPDRPPGEIRLLFQPSEESWDSEGHSGATRMIEDRALDGVDAVIALHVESLTPAGKIKVVSGQSQAAVDAFEAVIHGKGGHGAAPHNSIDPIFILAQVINAIHGIRARRIKPISPAVISIGAVHAGDAPNVIPDAVQMRGTIRSFDEDTRAQLSRDLEGAFGVARALGGDFELNIMRGYPSSYNDPWTIDLMREVGGDLFGAEEIIEGEPTMGAEDFSYMLQRAPGAMFMLGAQVDEDDRPHHSPIFDIEESIFYRGAAMLAETACRLLREKANS